MIIRVEKFFDHSSDILLTSKAGEVEISKVILKACEKKRDMLRSLVETNPKHCPESLEEDLVFILGMIKGLNWVLELPGSCLEAIKKIQ